MINSDTSKEKKFFFLEKQAFWDAIRIRYNIPLERLPTLCVCGDSFNLQHNLSCPKGVLVITRHNEMKNLTAEILGKVCKNVVIAPLLTPLTEEEFPKSPNTSNQSRADVSARGLWINRQTAFCEVRVFNPLARCHLRNSLPAVHKKNESEKKREYITSESFKWSMECSHHLCFHVFEERAGNAVVSFRILLNVLLIEEKNLK